MIGRSARQSLPDWLNPATELREGDLTHIDADRLPPRLADALAAYLARREINRPVSIASMVRRTRYVLPDIPYSDRELGDMIAQAIIVSGGNVDFDSPR